MNNSSAGHLFMHERGLCRWRGETSLLYLYWKQCGRVCSCFKQRDYTPITRMCLTYNLLLLLHLRKSSLSLHISSVKRREAQIRVSGDTEVLDRPHGSQTASYTVTKPLSAPVCCRTTWRQVTPPQPETGPGTDRSDSQMFVSGATLSVYVTALALRFQIQTN